MICLFIFVWRMYALFKKIWRFCVSIDLTNICGISVGSQRDTHQLRFLFIFLAREGRDTKALVFEIVFDGGHHAHVLDV